MLALVGPDCMKSGAGPVTSTGQYSALEADMAVGSASYAQRDSPCSLETNTELELVAGYPDRLVVLVAGHGGSLLGHCRQFGWSGDTISISSWLNLRRRRRRLQTALGPHQLFSSEGKAVLRSAGESGRPGAMAWLPVSLLSLRVCAVLRAVSWFKPCFR